MAGFNPLNRQRILHGLIGQQSEMEVTLCPNPQSIMPGG